MKKRTLFNRKEYCASVRKALKTLKQSIDLLHNQTYKELYSILRDSVIVRFEYSTAVVMDLLRLAIQEKEWTVIGNVSFQEILQWAFDIDLVDEETFQVMERCLKDHHLVPLMHDEELAENLMRSVSEYYVALQTIVDRLDV